MQITHNNYYRKFCTPSKLIVSFLCSLFFICISVVNVFSVTYYSMDNAEVERTWKHTDIQLVDNNLNKEMIVSFDVSENEDIVIATENEIIVVMDSAGNYLKTFTFNMDGSYFVQWNNNNIMLLSVRGHFAIEFTLDGELVDIDVIESSSASSLWQNLRKQKTITTEENNYTISQNMGFLSGFLSGYTYTTLTKTDILNNQSILYDVSTPKASSAVIKWLGIFSFVVLVVLIFVISMVSYYKNRR